MKEKKVIFISGASSGIGKAVLERFIQKEYAIGYISRSEEKIHAIHSEFKHYPHIQGYCCDISQQTDVEHCFKETKKQFGFINYAVHSAGDGAVGAFSDIPSDVWRKSFDAKLMGAVNLTKAFLNNRESSQQPGSIAVINGIFDREPLPLFPVSAAVNAALTGFSKAISRELAQHNIRINVINPGVTETPLWKDISENLAALEHTTPEAINKTILQAIPLKKFATGKDIANVVEFLLSKQSSHITGSAIKVDGGATFSI